METIILNAKLRESKGKKSSKKIRKSNNIPAVMYGKKSENFLLELSTDEIMNVLKKGAETSLLQLNIDSDKFKEPPLVILKDVQRDCISRKILHIDLHRVSMDEKIHIQVPLHFEGVSIGVKEGGILEKNLREIEIKCFPNNIPEYLSIDITNLAMGHSLHVSDITPPEGIEIVTEKETTVVSVIKPKEEAVSVAEEAEAPEKEKVEEKEAKEEKQKEEPKAEKKES